MEENKTSKYEQNQIHRPEKQDQETIPYHLLVTVLCILKQVQIFRTHQNVSVSF